MRTYASALCWPQSREASFLQPFWPWKAKKSTEGCLRSCDALEACENMRTIAPTVRIRTQSSILFFKPLFFWLVLSFSYRLGGCCVFCSSLRHFLVDSVVQGFRLYSVFRVWAEIAPRPVHPPREMTSGDSGARREADGSGFLPQLFSTGRPWITQQHGQLHAVLYPLGLLSSSPRGRAYEKTLVP